MVFRLRIDLGKNNLTSIGLEVETVESLAWEMGYDIGKIPFHTWDYRSVAILDPSPFGIPLLKGLTRRLTLGAKTLST